jgi:O-antigen ligase
MRADLRTAALPATAAPAGTGATRFVLWAFYLYVFSLPFEFPQRSIPVETTTITGAVFLLAALTQPSVCFRRPPAPFWLFVAYMYAILISFAVNGAEYPQETIKTLITRSQLIVIFLVAYNLMRDPKVARSALLLFGVACVILGAAMLTGVVGMVEEGKPRVTAFGQNPNRSALYLGTAVLVLVGSGFAGVRPPFRPRLLAAGLAAVAALASLNTGSRGGLLALAGGLWVLTLGGSGIKTRLRNATVALVGMAALGWAALQSPIMVQRLERAQAGDLAGRDYIFPLAWDMFVERPIFGWSAAGNSYELAMRISDGVHLTRDTHNLELELITTVGIVGTVPFFAGLIWCILSAWRGRHGPLAIVPFAMTALLMAANQSSNYIGVKLLWFVLAVALATGRLLPAAAPPVPPAPAPLPRGRPWPMPTAG